MTNRMTPREAVATVATIALGTGLLEATLLTAKARILGTFTWIESDAFWMAPLAYLAIYGALALLLTAMWRWKPQSANAWTVVAPFAGLSVYFLLLSGFTTQFHWLARALLSVGAAVQLARWYGARAAAPGWGAPAAMGLLGLTLVLAGWQLFLPSLLPTVPTGPVPPPSAPNVLLIVMDVVRAKSLSLYGYERPTTPSLVQWARRGVVFDSAYAPSPWTLPSHSSLFTGLPHRELGVDWRIPLDRRHPVLAERFGAAGYRTGGFVGNWFYTTRQSGLARGFDQYLGLRRTLKQTMLSSTPGQLLFGSSPGQYSMERDADRRNASVVTQEFLAWSAQEDPRPFFAFLNYFDAHKPRVAPPDGYPPFVTGRSEQDGYDGNIWYIDHELGGLLAQLDRSGVLDKTVVVITSDHGELFGEHGLNGHGTNLYLPALHVPLMILGGGVPQGVHIGRAVSLTDLAATLEELRGVGDRSLPGRSLVGCWSGATCEPSLISAAVTRSPWRARKTPASRGPLVTIIADGWQYIGSSTGEEQLYRLTPAASDDNVAARPDLGETLARLRHLSEPYVLPEPKKP
ncbi:MAG: sulfatase [Gemmatimonadales bacterium]